jgi:hypothetical protein
MKTKKLTMTWFSQQVSVSEREKKAPSRCTVGCDKEQYLTGKTGRKDISCQCASFCVCLFSVLAWKYFMQ